MVHLYANKCDKKILGSDLGIRSNDAYTVIHMHHKTNLYCMSLHMACNYILETKLFCYL